MIVKKKNLLMVSVLTIALDSTAVLAQALEEVMVTARKRNESLQDVPVVVTALNRDAIERLAIENLDDLSKFVPGMTSISSGGTDPSGTMSLRGVKTGSINVTSDQSVSLIMDGMPVENVLGYRAGQVDLAQIEVLKGPQALFFGKNSPGGVISITTASPNDELYMRARAGYEIEDGDKTGEFIVSGPITDTLGARAVVSYIQREGFISNNDPTAVYDDLPASDQWVARGTLLWEPSDVFSALAKITYSESEGDSRNDTQKIVCFDPSATTANCNLNDITTIAAPLDLLGRYDGLSPYDDADSTFGTLKLVWDVSDSLTLTSITGFYDINQNFYDVTTPRGFGDLAIFDVDENGNPIFLPNEILNKSDSETSSVSQELRLESNYDGPLNFMLGAFVDDRTIDVDAKVQFGAIGVPDIRQRVDAEAFSVFGQIQFDITDTWELSAGVRYTDEEKTYSGYIGENALLAAPGFVIVPPAGTPPEFFLGFAGDVLVPSKAKITPSNVSPEATLTWRPTDSVTLFAAYKEGFKSGSFDTSSTANQALLAEPFDISFDNEEVVGGEVGFKTMWADDQLRLNGAIYYYDYEDLQLDTFDPETVSTRTLNAGKSEVKGFELEFQYAPEALTGLTIYGSYNYNDAEYREFTTDCSQSQIFAGECPPGGFQDLAGAPLTNAPENSANLGFNFNGQFGGGFNYTVGALAFYSDEYQANSKNDPLGIQDSYTTLALNASISTPDNRWTLEFIGRNVTDEDYFISTVSQPFTGIPETIQEDFLATKARGRQVIAQLTYLFE
ncbi:MAG: TonB-dependent receptor [Pseudomonadota bacterium]